MLAAVVVSLVVHGAVALAFESAAEERAARLIETDLDVVSVAPDEPADKQAATPPAPSSSNHAHAQDKPTPETLPSGQVVDVAAGNDQKANDPKYLAEHDNRTAQETRAKEQTPFYAQAMPRQTNTENARDDKKVKGTQGTSTDDAAEAHKTQVAEHEIPKTLEQPKVATFQRSDQGDTRAPGDATNTSGLADRLRLRPGMLAAVDPPTESEGKAGTPDAAEHPGSAGVPGAAVGAAPNDFLQVPTGDGTFLNTREFKYASFFNRIKQRVGEQWSPNDVLRRRDPQNHAGMRRRVTVVDITLDDQGRITDIQVEQSCGIDFLDEEAVAAFRRAQPFPNPPTGLMGADGQIRIRFGFHLDSTPSSMSPFQFGTGRH